MGSARHAAASRLRNAWPMPVYFLGRKLPSGPFSMPSVCSRTLTRSVGLAAAEEMAPAPAPATIFFHSGISCFGVPGLTPASGSTVRQAEREARSRGVGTVRTECVAQRGVEAVAHAAVRRLPHQGRREPLEERASTLCSDHLGRAVHRA